VAFFFAGIGESPPQWCNPSAHGLTVATDIHVLAAELLGLGAATMQRSRARDVTTLTTPMHVVCQRVGERHDRIHNPLISWRITPDDRENSRHEGWGKCGGESG